MPSHRSLRIAEAIREVVSSAILFDVADPRIRAVTVLRVEVSGDLRNASIYVSVMGTPSEKQLAMNGLKHATGFLQARVAKRLQIRFTPVLVFKHDDSVKKAVAMSRLIDEALADDRLAQEQAGVAAETSQDGPSIDGGEAQNEADLALDQDSFDDEDHDEEAPPSDSDRT